MLERACTVPGRAIFSSSVCHRLLVVRHDVVTLFSVSSALSVLPFFCFLYLAEKFTGGPFTPERNRPLTPPMPEAAGAVGPSATGSTQSAATGERDSEFRQLGAAALAENLASYAFGPGDDSERAAFVEKARRGMIS